MMAAVLGAGLWSAGAPAAQEQPKPGAVAQAAVQKAIGYLKSGQKNGNWELGFRLEGQNSGGITALATLALLEAGVKADDPAVVAALAYLKKQQPEFTYAASLQTLVFCKADPKAHATEIQRNADWLVKTAKRGTNGVAGWGYPAGGGAALPAAIDCDFSNTHFAVEALHAAARAGAKVESKFWKDVHAGCAAAQLPSGGWSYHHFMGGEAGGERLTMTAAGVSCLAAAQERCGAEAKLDGAPLERGVARLGERLTFAPTPGATVAYPYYQLAVIKKAAQLAGKKTFTQDGVEVDWRRVGTDSLVKTQQPNGKWSGPGIDGVDLIATSFALRFLAD